MDPSVSDKESVKPRYPDQQIDQTIEEAQESPRATRMDLVGDCKAGKLVTRWNSQNTHMQRGMQRKNNSNGVGQKGSFFFIKKQYTYIKCDHKLKAM